MARQSKKRTWERSLQASAHWGGWGLSENYGKVRLKLQFPADAGIASASATLRYPWAASSIQPFQGLLNRIYGPFMEGGITLKTAIAELLAISEHKSLEVVTGWPRIVTAFKHYKLNLSNRIAPKTFEASYGIYLSVALLHLQGHGA